MKDILAVIAMLIVVIGLMIIIAIGGINSAREQQIQQQKLNAWLNECARKNGHVQTVTTQIFDMNGKTDQTLICNFK